MTTTRTFIGVVADGKVTILLDRRPDRGGRVTDPPKTDPPKTDPPKTAEPLKEADES